MTLFKIIVQLLLMGLISASTKSDDTPIVFPEDEEAKKVLKQTPTTKSELMPRFGFNNAGVNFGVEPSPNGITASGSFSNSYGNQGQNQGHSGSQSHSFNVNLDTDGFSGSQSSSQASSFNTQFPGYFVGGPSPHISGSQASSQTSGFSASATGGISGSQASSQSSGFTGSFGGAGNSGLPVSVSSSGSSGSSQGGGGISSSQSGGQGAGFSGTFGSRYPGSQNNVFSGGFSEGHHNPLFGFGGYNRRPENIPLEFIRRNRPQLRNGNQHPDYSLFSGVVVSRRSGQK